jgi:hypothetical protein
MSATKASGLEEPLHYGTASLPDQGGVFGLNAHRITGGWLLMTLGLTELFGKVSDDPDVSGWGFELTMRVPRGDSEQRPPGWALNLLGQLSSYVFSAGKPFAAGHRLSPGGPITGTADTLLTAVAFAPDPDLTAIRTPHGSVEFLTVFGITAEELARMQQSSTADVLADLRSDNPSLLTDPGRR